MWWGGEGGRLSLLKVGGATEPSEVGEGGGGGAPMP